MMRLSAIVSVVVSLALLPSAVRASSRFRGIVKAIRDITGRPSKSPEKEPDQLEFAFPDAA